MKNRLWLVLVALLASFPAFAGFNHVQSSSGATIDWNSGNVLPTAQWVPAPSTVNVGGGASWNTSTGTLIGYGAGKVPIGGAGSVIDVSARVVPNPTLVGAAIGNFLKKTILPLQVGLAAYDLAQELGFLPTKDSSGNLTVQKSDPTVCSVSPCYNWVISSYPSYSGSNGATVCNNFAVAYNGSAGPGYGTFTDNGNGSGFCYVYKQSGAYNNGFGMGRTTVSPSPPSYINSSLQELQDAIALKSGWPTSSNVSRAVADAINSGEDVQKQSVTVSGPSSVAGPSKTTTNPDGTSSTQNTTYNISYNQNTITTTTTVTTVYKDSSGNTTGTKTDTSGGDNPKSDCDTHPDTVGCQTLGAPPTAENIPTTPTPVTFASVAFAAPAGCPAPYTGQIKVLSFVKQWSITFDPMCDLMNTLRPLFLATGAAAAAFLFMESLKS